MSEINSLLSSLGLSPESENSNFFTTSTFRRYHSNVKSNKPTTNVASSSGNVESFSLPTTPVVKRKRGESSKTSSKAQASLAKKPRSKKELMPEKKKNTTVHDPDSKAPIRKVTRYCPKLDSILLCLKCEWADCEITWNSMDDFLSHVDLHLAEIELMTDPDNQVYKCDWKECDFDPFECLATFKRHVRFHAFHTKLKQIGQNVLQTLQNNLDLDNNPNQQVPKCNLDELSRNIIPELPYKFECAWDNCLHSTDNPELFYRHIKVHVDEYPKNLLKANCKWSECKQIILNKSRFSEHIRHHSQEKLVSCPVCGSLFSSFTRFIDHCSRSSDPGNLMFQCSHCNKKFATNNLLKEHTRKHINKIKCPVCDMTCTDRNELSKHILYKHTSHKPYKCDQCDHASKSEFDLQKHIHLKHNERYEYQCNDCEFKTKDMNNMKRHMLKFHMSNQNTMNLNDGQQFSSSYMCHVCNKVYCQGSTLSKHLKKAHNFEWPSGHSRFRYKLESDGFYRLQTLRYESLELFELLNKKVATSSSDTISTPTIINSETQPQTSGSTIDYINTVQANEQEKTPPFNPINFELIPDIQQEIKFDGSLAEKTPTKSVSAYTDIQEIEKELNQQPHEIRTVKSPALVAYNADEINFGSFETNQMAGDVNQSFLMQLETPTKINSQELVLSKKTASSQQLQVRQSYRLEFDLENFFLGSNFEMNQ